ncbi:MAG: hypothetical protein KAZ88_12990 [Acidimicrobiia bacterium]|nr:hypothetical protein [Acidimicrobiia bacterium]
MANVRVQWVLPTTRESGKPLAAADIAAVAIEISADGGANYSPVGEFGADVLETTVADVDFGEFFFRGTVRDTKGRVSNPVVASVVNEDTTPPSELTVQLSLI